MNRALLTAGPRIAAAALCVLLLHNPTRASVGSDNSADPAYSGGWANGSNGGTGFAAWQLVSSSSANGFAGFFRQTTPGSGVDNAGQPTPQDGSAWASFANKGNGIDRATAFRQLANSLDGAGDAFSATLEMGVVNGSAGMSLRHGNAAVAPDDFSANARMQLLFRGGHTNYAIVDAAGEFDTGVPVSFLGIKPVVRLTGANTYDIDLISYDAPNDPTPMVTTFVGRTLAGSGTIDSVALFNQDSVTQSDVFFNKLAYAAAGGSGADDASGAAYNAGWNAGANGGSGFGPWEFAAATQGGFAGQFIQNNPGNGVDNIGTSGGNPVRPDGAVWASYANKGDSLDKSAQYRNLVAPLAANGDSFSVSLDNGFIDESGGKVGMSLRDRAVATGAETPDSFADTARLQFYFRGGDNHYTLLDDSGQLDTGIPFTFFGVDLKVTLTGPNAYNLDVTRYDATNDPAPQHFSFPGRALAGTGSIESLAFFNHDGPTQSDVYFNNLSYRAITGKPADFDADGDVDGGDFLRWQRGFGSTNQTDNSNGDADANGAVTGADLVSWSLQFGPAATATLTSVPEPCGILLALLAASATVAVRPRAMVRANR